MGSVKVVRAVKIGAVEISGRRDRAPFVTTGEKMRGGNGIKVYLVLTLFIFKT